MKKIEEVMKKKDLEMIEKNENNMENYSLGGMLCSASAMVNFIVALQLIDNDHRVLSGVFLGVVMASIISAGLCTGKMVSSRAKNDAIINKCLGNKKQM